MLQIVFYQSGVQPEANFLGEFVGDDAKLSGFNLEPSQSIECS